MSEFLWRPFTGANDKSDWPASGKPWVALSCDLGGDDNEVTVSACGYVVGCCERHHDDARRGGPCLGTPSEPDDSSEDHAAQDLAGVPMSTIEKDTRTNTAKIKKGTGATPGRRSPGQAVANDQLTSRSSPTMTATPISPSGGLQRAPGTSGDATGSRTGCPPTSRSQLTTAATASPTSQSGARQPPDGTSVARPQSPTDKPATFP